jgi:hypothetical protein
MPIPRVRFSRLILVATIITLLAASACNLPFATKTTATSSSTIGQAVLTESASTIQSRSQGTQTQAKTSAPGTAVTPVAGQPFVTDTPNLQLPAATQNLPGQQLTVVPALTLAPTGGANQSLSATSIFWIFTPLPPFTARPTITSIPNPAHPIRRGLRFYVDEVNIHNCSSTPWAIFQIFNAGTYTLESLYLAIQDETTNQTLFGPVASDLPFMTSDRICSYNGVDSLPSGQASYIGAPIGFATQHTLQATIKFCTVNGLSGNCLEKVVEFVVP